jgi:hypothetical protein
VHDLYRQLVLLPVQNFLVTGLNGMFVVPFTNSQPHWRRVCILCVTCLAVSWETAHESEYKLPRDLETMCSMTFLGPLLASHPINLNLMRTGNDWRCSPVRWCQEPCPGGSVSACDEVIRRGTAASVLVNRWTQSIPSTVTSTEEEQPPNRLPCFGARTLGSREKAAYPIPHVREWGILKPREVQ